MDSFVLISFFLLFVISLPRKIKPERRLSSDEWRQNNTIIHEIYNNFPVCVSKTPHVNVKVLSG
jgi:hypothetical protein